MFAVARAPTVARMTMERAGLGLIIAGTPAVCPTTASAQMFTASCTDGLGDSGSLVHAIDDANFAPGADTVEVGRVALAQGRVDGARCTRPPSLQQQRACTSASSVRGVLRAAVDLDHPSRSRRPGARQPLSTRERVSAPRTTVCALCTAMPTSALR